MPHEEIDFSCCPHYDKPDVHGERLGWHRWVILGIGGALLSWIYFSNEQLVERDRIASERDNTHSIQIGILIEQSQAINKALQAYITYQSKLDEEFGRAGQRTMEAALDAFRLQDTNAKKLETLSERIDAHIKYTGDK